MDSLHTIMYSGGIDSFLVYQYLRKNTEISKVLTLLYFNIGARCTQCEIDLFQTCKFKQHVQTPVIVSDCLNMGNLETETAYIPNRNILTAIMTNSVNNSDRIWIGGTLSDRVNDNNKEIFQDLSNLLTKMHKRNIVIDSPFYDVHKCSLVHEYVETNGWGHYENKQQARMSLIESTFSCYDPLRENQEVRAIVSNEEVFYKTKECLMCSACFRKCLSLYAGDIFIPMNNCRISKDIVDKYYKEAIENINNDIVMHDRYDATIKYCEKFYQYCN